jgi:ribosomal protein S18 acetylase RimI-like enzyme
MTAELQPAQLAATLGVPMFTTDMHMPVYREARIGQWRLTRTGFCLDNGYYTGLCGVSGMPVLLRIGSGTGDNWEDWETWMSLSPHEIESQELGCRYAHGHTVVMGLGMGWVAINMALNPAVTMVTIIERDPEVIELFRQSDALHGLADNVTAKIRIILADALEWQPETKVDFLYADIWRCLEEPQTVDDVRRMQTNVQAKSVYFWGQELAIYSLTALKREECASDEEWAAEVQRSVAEDIALPLLLPDEFDYPRMIAEVVRLRRKHFPDSVPNKAVPPFTLRPITDNDLEFLLQLYASTRLAEKPFFNMNDEQWNEFIMLQFNCQHVQYMRNYDNATFDLVLVNDQPVGRLFVDWGKQEFRIVDIAFLPEFCGRGMGRKLIKSVITKAEKEGVPVTLHVEKFNPARHLYESLGFQPRETASDVYMLMQRPPGQPNKVW